MCFVFLTSPFDSLILLTSSLGSVNVELDSVAVPAVNVKASSLEIPWRDVNVRPIVLFDNSAYCLCQVWDKMVEQKGKKQFVALAH